MTGAEGRRRGSCPDVVKASRVGPDTAPDTAGASDVTAGDVAAGDMAAGQARQLSMAEVASVADRRPAGTGKPVIGQALVTVASGRSPAEGVPQSDDAGGGYRYRSLYLPSEVFDRSRNAFWALRDREGEPQSLSDWWATAGALLVEQQEREANSGRPFPPAPDRLPKGPSRSGSARGWARRRGAEQ